MSFMGHEEYKMMLPLQALSSLDGDEAQALEGHLTGCAECRSELDVWRGSAGALAYAAAPLEPSPLVRARILETVSAESREQQANNVIPIKRGAAAPVSPGSSLSWMLPIAAVIVLGLIVGIATLWGQNRKANAVIAGLTKQLDETTARLNKEQVALQVLLAPGARMAELDGTKQSPGAHGMVAVDGKTRRAVFMVQGLPQAPEGKAYQLWFIAGAKPMPGKVFKTDATGSAMMMDDQVPSEALAAGTFAVTLEPEGGAPAPTGAMYLVTKA
jgi:anti-sigma-K factor RskA